MREGNAAEVEDGASHRGMRAEVWGVSISVAVAELKCAGSRARRAERMGAGKLRVGGEEFAAAGGADFENESWVHGIGDPDDTEGEVFAVGIADKDGDVSGIAHRKAWKLIRRPYISGVAIDHPRFPGR